MTGAIGEDLPGTADTSVPPRGALCSSLHRVHGPTSPPPLQTTATLNRDDAIIPAASTRERRYSEERPALRRSRSRITLPINELCPWVPFGGGSRARVNDVVVVFCLFFCRDFRKWSSLLCCPWSEIATHVLKVSLNLFHSVLGAKVKKSRR